MRAGKIASVIMVLIVTIVATGVRSFTFWAFEMESTPTLTRLIMFFGVVAFVSAIVLVPMGFVIDRHLLRLQEFMRESQRGQESAPALSLANSRWLRPILSAFTGVVETAKQRELALRAQLGDLEIRHRVSEVQRRQTEAVLHALRDAVIVTDAFNEVVMVNHAAARIFGFDAADALHHPIERIIQHEELLAAVRSARDRGDCTSAMNVEITLPDASGDLKRVFHVTLTAIANTAAAKAEKNASQAASQAQAGVDRPHHAAPIAGVVTILHDLTRERELSQMKSDFVSKASHELRTPLSSIRAYVEMLVDGEAADETSRQEFYRVIHNETDRLSRLIDNMLNISRIEAGIVQVQRDLVDMKALINRAVHTIGPQAEEKGISLHVRLAPPTVDLCVEGDADMLYQVVLNLLSNAVKYTPGASSGDGHGPGRVTISADATGLGIGGQKAEIRVPAPNARAASGKSRDSMYPAAAASQTLAMLKPSTESRQASESPHSRSTHSAPACGLVPSVVVTISDTGFGIPPDAMPRLFDKFFRIDNYQRVAKGTGLGLSLCKHIVETVHDGQIGVESTLGMGSKFWFSIPMKYAGKKAA